MEQYMNWLSRPKIVFMAQQIMLVEKECCIYL